MPIFAISLMAIMALVGATLALSMDSRSANNLQHTADAAALGGATAFLNSTSPKAETRLAEARQQAASLASENSEYSLVDLDIGALTEDPYGQHTELAVEIEFKPVNAMAQVTGRNASIGIRRRAVAAATWGFPLCMLALGEDDKTGFASKHSARLLAKGCLVWSNADGKESMDFKSGTIAAKYLCAAGGAKSGKRADISPRPEEECETIPDPLADMSFADPGNCTPPPDFDPPRYYTLLGQRNYESGGRGGEDDDDDDEGSEPIGDLVGGVGDLADSLLSFDDLALYDNLPILYYILDRYYSRITDTISPGTYCGLDISWGHVEMEPGTYYIKNAPMTVTRKARVTADGVTIVFDGPGAHLRVSDMAQLKLTAPSSGPNAGIAIAERRNTREKKNRPTVTRLTGSGTMSIIGLVYIPTQNFFISGSGAGDQSSPLLQIVANQLAIRDDGELRIDFQPGKTSVPMLIQPSREARLVE